MRIPLSDGKKEKGRFTFFRILDRDANVKQKKISKLCTLQVFGHKMFLDTIKVLEGLQLLA